MSELKCPFLKQVEVCYCSASPIKKYIPVDKMAEPHSPCSSTGFAECHVYQNSAGITPEEMEKVKESYVLKVEKNECVWMNQEKVSYRLCTKNYECEKCEFEQQLVERDGRYVEPPDMVQEIKRSRTMPVSERRCKYVLISGRVTKEPCLYKYECWRCPIYQRIRSSVTEIKT